MKMEKNMSIQFIKLRIISSFLILFLSFSALAQDKSAYEIWNEMTEAGLNFDKTQTLVKGAEGVKALDSDGKEIKNAGQMVMFGGEKEGSSSLITRIMGPDKDGLKDFVNELEKKDEFLRAFLSDFSSGQIKVKEVRDAKGVLIPFDLEGLKGVNYSSLSRQELMQKFQIFLDRGGDKSFSHINKQTRIKIFNGNYPGLTSTTGLKENVSYDNYKSLYGEAEKFIDAAHGTSVGWEINFIPQRSYGEFEFMIDWFRTELKNVGQKFEAPGHQWIVYPKSKAAIESPEEAAKLIDKLGEVEKNIQAYIVLKGVEGGAGIELANYKTVHPDFSLTNDHETQRGVIRLENERFDVDGQKAFALEFRAGVKSDKIRRMHQKFLVSRYAANEYDDLASGKSWTLNDGRTYDSAKLMKRFGVSRVEADKFLSAVGKASITKMAYGSPSQKSISHEYLAPLWNWEEAPYLSSGKKEEVRKLTNTYIKTVANLNNPDMPSVRLAMRDWVKTSQIATDIENYLKPKQKLKNTSEAHIYPVKSGAKVDVNQIDFGIEYSARYPLKSNAEFVPIPNQAGKYEWQATHYGYSDAERENVIERFAKRLGEELNGAPVEVKALHSNGHGHGLDIAYEVKDKNGKKWRVEWDGIGRSYDVDSKRIEGSVRGGHIEIVTPKFVPDADAMKKLYTAMEKESLIPSTRFGGGHINIDLKPFDGEPKKMARFLGAYLDNRDVMSMLFQHAGRQVGAEPVKVSQNLINQLKKFDGDERELKQLLYNEKFFNTRIGRKTKNNQLNILAYIQDVIPEELIHSDFDMKNDMWRRTFDVDPKIRKMEFRLFNAPRNAAESALQIKFTKALLNKALNETDDVFINSPHVDYLAMARDPKMAFAKFEKTMKSLGLNASEYKGFLLEGLEVSKNVYDSPSFLPLEEKLSLHPEVADWGKAVEPRANPISSEGRVWSGNDILPEAKVYKQQQMLAREHAASLQSQVNFRGKLDRKLEKMPLEASISIDEIKKLNNEEALIALYYQKSKTKNETSAHRKFLEEVLAKSQSDLPSMASYAINISPGYQKFLVEKLPGQFEKSQGNSYISVYKELLSSNDGDVRKKAIAYLTQHPVGLEHLLFKANEIDDQKIVKEILASAQNIKVDAANVQALNALESIITKTDDPAAIRSILTLSKNMDADGIKNLYTALLDHRSPQISQMGHNHLRANFEKDYYFIAKDKINLKGYSPENKKILGKFLSETKVFDKLSAKELFALPENHILPLAKKMIEDPSLDGNKRATIVKTLANPEKVELFQNQIIRNADDVEVTKWAYQNLINSEKFKYSDDPKNLEMIRKMLESSNPQINDLGLEMLKKVNTKIARASVIPTVLNNPNALESVKTKLYSKVLNNADLLDEVVKYDGTSVNTLLDAVKTDINKPGINRTNSAKLLSHLSAEGNLKANTIMSDLIRSSDKSTRNVALVLYGNSNLKSTHEMLPQFFNDKPLNATQLKLIQNGIDKQEKFIKSLSAADLKKKEITDKLWLLYKNDTLPDNSNNLEIAEILKKDPDTLRTINKVIAESNAKGKADPYAKWLMAQASSPKFKPIIDGDPTLMKELVYNALNSPDADVIDKAFKLLKAQKVSAADFISNDSRFKLDDDSFIQKVLSRVEVTPNDFKMLSQNTDFQSRLLQGLNNATDPKSKTIIAQLATKIPGSSMDKTMKYLSEYYPTKQMAVITKNRNSHYAFESMLYMKNSTDPVIKEQAIAGLEAFSKKARELTSLADLDTSEALSMIYHKSKNTKGQLDVTSLLKQIKNKDDLLPYVNDILQEYDGDAKYKKWILELLENSENIEAMGFKHKEMKTILQAAMENSQDEDVKKATLKLIRNNKNLNVPEKVQIVASTWDPTEEVIDTLKYLAGKNPKSPHFETAIQRVFENTWRDDGNKIAKRKSAELLMMLPTETVENVIAKYKASYGADKANDLYLLLGSAKHKSPVVVELAKTNLNSSDPVLQRTATRVNDKWEKKGTTDMEVNKAKCIGRSVRNVLNRLTFR